MSSYSYHNNLYHHFETVYIRKYEQFTILSNHTALQLHFVDVDKKDSRIQLLHVRVYV